MPYKSSSFHLSFYIRCFSPWPSCCTSAGLTAICQCLSWTSPKLDTGLQMWLPMCQTEGKDHFPASADYPVGNNHLGCGWLAHYWLTFHLLSTGTCRSVSVKLLCSSVGIWGFYILDVGLQLLLLKFIHFLLTPFPASWDALRAFLLLLPKIWYCLWTCQGMTLFQQDMALLIMFSLSRCVTHLTVCISPICL